MTWLHSHAKTEIKSPMQKCQVVHTVHTLNVTNNTETVPQIYSGKSDMSLPSRPSIVGEPPSPPPPPSHNALPSQNVNRTCTCCSDELWSTTPFPATPSISSHSPISKCKHDKHVCINELLSGMMEVFVSHTELEVVVTDTNSLGI